MIWLRDENDSNDTITCNKIVGNNDKLKYLEQLKKELYNDSSYILKSAEAYKGEELRPIPKNPLSMQKDYQLGFDRYAGHLYARMNYVNLKAYSLIFHIEMNKSQYEKRLNIRLLDMFGGDISKVDMIENLRVNLDNDTFAFLMNKIWEDFYFFTTEILGNISFEEISRYDIDELRNIQMLCDKNSVETSATNVLKYVDEAYDNSKILKLARAIRNR